MVAAEIGRLRAHMEAKRRLAIAENNGRGIRNAAIIEVLVGTGLRVSEATALTVGDVDLETGAGAVVVRCGKGRKARVVPVNDGLVGYLAAYLSWKASTGASTDAASPLFASRKHAGHMTRSAVHRVWKAALKSAGLATTWKVHSTRHSFAIEIYRKTKDLRLCQKVLGHSSPSITQVYVDVLADDVRRGVAMLWS